jgi:hypothetical protein
MKYISLIKVIKSHKLLLKNIMILILLFVIVLILILILIIEDVMVLGQLINEYIISNIKKIEIINISLCYQLIYWL